MKQNGSNPKTRTIVYSRVSTEDQALMYGLPAQKRACGELAKARGLNVIEVIEDDMTGTVMERPGLDRLRALVRAGEVDVVLIYAADRLSRRPVHLLILKEEIEKRARLEFVSATYDDSPSGRMFFGFTAHLAEYERELIRMRTMAGKRERVTKGLLVGGRIAYGYRYRDGQLIPDEQRAPIVKNIFDSYDGGGFSMRQIALRLRMSNAPTWSGKQWGRTSVHRILMNETYAGTAYYGTHKREGKVLRLRAPSERIAVAVPPLIDREQWTRVQARIATNPKVGRPSDQYLLRGLLYCSCGRRMSGERRRAYRSYRCSGRDALRFHGESCRHAVGSAKIDAAVWDAIVRTFTDAAFLRATLAEHQLKLQNDQPEALEHIRAQVRKLKAKEETAFRALLDPDLADSRRRIKDHYTTIQKELRPLEAELARLEKTTPTPENPAWLDETVELLRGYIPTLTQAAQRQEFLRGMVTRVNWDGTEVRMVCVVGPKSDTMSS